MAARDTVEQAADEDHRTFGDGDHVAGNSRHVKGQRRTALVQGAEQHRREDNADRMTAPEQRDGDPGEARSGGEEAVEPPHHGRRQERSGR